MPATAPPTFASLFDWRLPFSQLGGFAPDAGWTFGNLMINTTNSRAPQVEQAIVGKLSYGRQPGKVIEAVEVLCASLKTGRNDAGAGSGGLEDVGRARGLSSAGHWGCIFIQ